MPDSWLRSWGDDGGVYSDGHTEEDQVPIFFCLIFAPW